ncbi:MAG: Coenzyme F420 hydrogenase/dehydrogenase, beta subunit C-terminal domain [Thiomonas sp.]|uniref:Coenzyme F420 hydrogenase/dehydrogenase, beta subunit C-terminal domain n=1 Tax=Thiomonas sp. TaxID=2047785 RepID=UPI002A364E11|nr:Coenzyme F420 hydrogenase/dehydrogenase, beta subunit C-terminal domain [Thiomonas sp.]MDY0331757.1 Coenzyme F420 hydrogenase/dehydrogenase, beta subunit C-terminal domain [Thiomonas sp.]
MNILQYHQAKNPSGCEKFPPVYECCGCGACKSSCPKQCIVMFSDEEGFLFPKIDNKICIECGICLKACQYVQIGNFIERLDSPLAFAAMDRHSRDLLNSSSGGIAHRLAMYVLERQGVVVGAVYDQDMKVKHQMIDSKQIASKLQGSKYVQSEINNTYIDAKECLEQGRLVLFTGTPCQIGGLYNFLGRDYENLYTVDIICFGVPSPKLFSEYIRWEQERHRSRVIDINFRDKSVRWEVPSTRVYFADSRKNKLQRSNENKYYKIFLSHNATRLCCHNCLYTKIERTSDITVGDYWGIAKFNSKIDCSKGISKVLINTIKGQKIYQAIGHDIENFEMPLETVIRANLQHPPKESLSRQVFFHDFKLKGFKYCSKKYVNNSIPVKIKNVLRSILRSLGLTSTMKNILAKMAKESNR